MIGRALLILALILPGLSRADTIEACAKTRNGKLRVVADPTECKKREFSISWESDGPEGPAGPEGPQGPAGAVLAVFDGDGNELGLFVVTARSSIIHVHLPDIGAAIRLRRDGTLPSISDAVLFEDPNCQGQAFTEIELSGWIFEADPDRFFVGSTDTFVTEIQAQSFLSGGEECFGTTGTQLNVVHASEFTGDLGLTFPLTPPLHVGVSQQ